MKAADDRQLAIPGVPAPSPAIAGRPSRLRHRAVHFDATVKGERRSVRVTIDGGMVRFRAKGSHSPTELDFNTWAGLGYWHAAKLAAAEAKEARRTVRRLRRIGGVQ